MRQSTGRRGSADESVLVILNLSVRDHEVWLPFPQPGTGIEQIDGREPAVQITQNDQWSPVSVPFNCGAVYKWA